MNSYREFRRPNTAGKDLVWKISQDKDTYTTVHGQLNGAMQTFSDTPGDKGKPGTKAYVNAIDNCSFHVDREIRKKLEHGYIEYINGNPVSVKVSSIDFSKQLPKNFCGYKPQTSITESALKKIHKNAYYTRKYDGMCFVAAYHTHGWEMYSRRMDISSARFPEHIKQLTKLNFKPGTIIIGELVCSNSDGTDNFKNISRICRSDPPVARELVSSGEINEPVLIIFDILFNEENDLKEIAYEDRLKLFSFLPEYKNEVINNSLIYRAETCKVAPNNWEEIAKRNNWEGFVVVDGKSVPGAKFYSFDGDAKRPKGHHKLKPTYTEDVVIYAGIYGTGKRLNKLGSVLMKQRDPEGNFIRCGKCGSGFTDEDLDEVERLLNKNNLPMYEKEKEDNKDINNTTGIVAEIEYGERQPKTQKFRFPVFLRVRLDKGVDECYIQRMAADE